ncbi:MAG: InlB B-repeat-containing protein [Clostridiales bacterium]|nr:InlB B-repeat-containing protein [Clostridiales bacterium]
MSGMPQLVSAADLPLSGGTLTVEASGQVSDGTSTHTLTPSDRIESNGDLDLVLNNTAPLEVQSITVNGTLTISGTGALVVENPSGTGIQVTNGDFILSGGTLDVTGLGTGVEVSGTAVISGPDSVVAATGENTHGFRVSSGGLSISGGARLEGYSKLHGLSLGGQVLVSGDGTLLYGEGEEWGIQAGTLTVADKGRVVGDCTAVSATSTVLSGVRATSAASPGYESMTVTGGGVIEGTGGYAGVYTAAGMTVTGDGSAIIGRDGGVVGVYAASYTSTGPLSQVLVTDGAAIIGSTSANYGFYSYYAPVTVSDGGTLDGTGSTNGVVVRESLSVDNGVIKGTVLETGSIPSVNEAVLCVNSAIRAENGGIVWENYPGITLAFDHLTPVLPHNTANITDIANYTWSPDLEVSGTGLTTQFQYDTVQEITGQRTGDAAGETVQLDANSTHRVTFLGTLNGPTPVRAAYTVTYDANGGAGTAPAQSDQYAGDIFYAAANSFTPPAGQTFREWNTQADGSGTGYAEGDPVVMPDAPLVLYAIWEAEEEPAEDGETPGKQDEEPGDTDTPEETDGDTEILAENVTDSSPGDASGSSDGIYTAENPKPGDLEPAAALLFLSLALGSLAAVVKLRKQGTTAHEQ